MPAFLTKKHAHTHAHTSFPIVSSVQPIIFPVPITLVAFHAAAFADSVSGSVALGLSAAASTLASRAVSLTLLYGEEVRLAFAVSAFVISATVAFRAAASLAGREEGTA